MRGRCVADPQAPGRTRSIEAEVRCCRPRCSEPSPQPLSRWERGFESRAPERYTLLDAPLCSPLPPGEGPGVRGRCVADLGMQWLATPDRACGVVFTRARHRTLTPALPKGEGAKAEAGTLAEADRLSGNNGNNRNGDAAPRPRQCDPSNSTQLNGNGTCGCDARADVHTNRRRAEARRRFDRFQGTVRSRIAPSPGTGAERRRNR